MRYTVTRQRITILGRLWMPGCTASLEKDLSSYDMANLGNPRKREDVERWLCLNIGDFSQVIDFKADFHVNNRQVVHEWEMGEESEMAYLDTLGQGD